MISAFRRERQVEISVSSEFQASLVNIASSRIAELYGETLSQKANKRKIYGLVQTPSIRVIPHSLRTPQLLGDFIPYL